MPEREALETHGAGGGREIKREYKETERKLFSPNIEVYEIEDERAPWIDIERVEKRREGDGIVERRTLFTREGEICDIKEFDINESGGATAVRRFDPKTNKLKSETTHTYDYRNGVNLFVAKEYGSIGEVLEERIYDETGRMQKEQKNIYRYVKQGRRRIPLLIKASLRSYKGALKESFEEREYTYSDKQPTLETSERIVKRDKDGFPINEELTEYAYWEGTQKYSKVVHTESRHGHIQKIRLDNGTVEAVGIGTIKTKTNYDKTGLNNQVIREETFKRTKRSENPITTENREDQLLKEMYDSRYEKVVTLQKGKTQITANRKGQITKIITDIQRNKRGEKIAWTIITPHAEEEIVKQTLNPKTGEFKSVLIDKEFTFDDISQWDRVLEKGEKEIIFGK